MMNATIPADAAPAAGSSVMTDYHRNRYAQRCHSVYIASLYSERLRQRSSNQEAEECECGGYNSSRPVIDAKYGLLSQRQQSQSTSGVTQLLMDLDVLSCDPNKRRLVSAPSQVDEVDILTASASAVRPPSRARPIDSTYWVDYPSHTLSHADWLERKHVSLVEEEARKKYAAITELTEQIRRRMEAQREYEKWKKHLSRRGSTPPPLPPPHRSASAIDLHLPLPLHSDPNFTAASSAPNPPSLTSSPPANRLTFAEWRREKDALHRAQKLTGRKNREQKEQKKKQEPRKATMRAASIEKKKKQQSSSVKKKNSPATEEKESKQLQSDTKMPQRKRTSAASSSKHKPSSTKKPSLPSSARPSTQ